jgi:hypothetical protein
MPVETEHPDYLRLKDTWKKCRTVVQGTEAVKAAGTAYLPKLGGQDEREYAAYVQRANFFAATKKTVEAMEGMIFAKEPVIKAPTSALVDIKSITSDGNSLVSFAKKITNEQITCGRYGVLVDADEAGQKVYLTGYVTESIINWRTVKVKGEDVLVMVVLMETVQDYSADPFAGKSSEQIRVLKLAREEGGDQPVYIQEIWIKKSASELREGESKFKLFKTIVPTQRGVKMQFIPFLFIGATDLTPAPDEPPISDLAEVNLSHYRSSADLEHGRHFTALPTPWAAGFDSKNGELKIGSTTAWLSDDPQAKCSFLEFTGQGLGALSTALEEKQGQMAVLGARLLEAPKPSVEAADSQKIRKSSESSILATLVDMLDDGLERVVKWLLEWAGVTGEVSVELNRDFSQLLLDTTMLSGLLSAFQQNAISYNTLFTIFKRAGIIPEDRTMEEEMALINDGAMFHYGLDLKTTPPDQRGGPAK